MKLVYYSKNDRKGRFRCIVLIADTFFYQPFLLRAFKNQLF